MSSNAEGKMNTARAKPYFRVYALGVLVLYLALLHLFFTQMGRGDVGEHQVGVAVVAAVMFLCLYVIARSHVVYRWNDEEIRCRTLFCTRSMRWDEIVEYDIRRFLGGWTRLILRDARGTRLKVHSYLLREESRLHGALRDKLTHLEEAVAKEVADAGEAHFPTRVGDVPGGTFIVRGDSLICKRGRNESEILLSQLHRGSQSWRYESLEQVQPASEVTELVSWDGTAIQIPSTTKGYDRLVAYIRHRAPGAAWITADGAQDGARLRCKLRLAHEQRNAILAAGFFTASVSINVILMIIGSQGQPSKWRRLAIAVEGLFLMALAVAIVWWAIGYVRELRRIKDFPN